MPSAQCQRLPLVASARFPSSHHLPYLSLGRVGYRPLQFWPPPPASRHGPRRLPTDSLHHSINLLHPNHASNHEQFTPWPMAGASSAKHASHLMRGTLGNAGQRWACWATLGNVGVGLMLAAVACDDLRRHAFILGTGVEQQRRRRSVRRVASLAEMLNLRPGANRAIGPGCRVFGFRPLVQAKEKKSKCDAPVRRVVSDTDSAERTPRIYAGQAVQRLPAPLAAPSVRRRRRRLRLLCFCSGKKLGGASVVLRESLCALCARYNSSPLRRASQESKPCPALCRASQGEREHGEARQAAAASEAASRGLQSPCTLMRPGALARSRRACPKQASPESQTTGRVRCWVR